MFPATTSTTASPVTGGPGGGEVSGSGGVHHPHHLRPGGNNSGLILNSPTLDTIRSVPSGAAVPLPPPPPNLALVRPSTILTFPNNSNKTYYTNSSPLYSNDLIIRTRGAGSGGGAGGGSTSNQHNNSTTMIQQNPNPVNPSQRMPQLFSVSSLVNMPSSPAPKSLDLIEGIKHSALPSITTSNSPSITPIIRASGGPVSLPSTELHPHHQQHHHHQSPSVSVESSSSPAMTGGNHHQLPVATTATTTHTAALASKEIFAACKMGDLSKLKRYLTPANVNIRDTSGGRSTVSLCFVI